MRYNNYKKNVNNRDTQGVTLLEIVVYVALLGMISVYIANFLITVVNTYQRARAEREVLSNGRLVLETINKDIMQAVEIYTPTSKFNNNSGQISLITSIGAPTEHTTQYVDYYVDNGRLWMRQEGQSAIPLSASSVQITQFRLEQIEQALNYEAVKITLTLNFSQTKFATSITLNATTALRGNY